MGSKDRLIALAVNKPSPTTLILLKENVMSHLNTIDIIRAWKDPEYRLSLSGAERAVLPEHPAGLMELTDVELSAAAGGHPYIRWVLANLYVENQFPSAAPQGICGENMCCEPTGQKVDGSFIYG